MGLRARIDEWRSIPVPLTGVSISGRLVNFTAEVTVTQTYINKGTKPLECEYMFPIEEEAAVVDFKVEIEGRTLVSQVKEKEQAKKDYDDAVASKKTGFLMQQARPDILQISVGHLSPGAAASISLTYITEAGVEGDQYRFTVPTTISPKYIPPYDNSPEAAAIASIPYDFKSPAKLTFKLEVGMKSRIQSVTSPSHAIKQGGVSTKDGLNTATVEFAATTADMDRDIVVLVASEDIHRSMVYVEEAEDTKVMMLSLVPKLEQPTRPELDVVFLVDCSGSMQGSSINLAREALNILLHSLPPSSSFNIVRFGSRYEELWPASQPYTDRSLLDAKEAVVGMQANLGGTEILTPLQKLLEEKTTIPRRIFVLTDGAVSNSHQCIKVVKKNNTRNRVFTLGIGAGADRHLVKGMARAGLGTAQFTTEGEAMAPKVLKQLKNCLQPSVEDLAVDWGLQVDSAQAPDPLPPVFDGQRLQIFKLVEKGVSLPSKVKVTANLPATKSALSEEVVVGEALQGQTSLIHKMFARKMIQSLEEKYEDEEKEEIKALVTELALKYKLMSTYTSFVAVDTKVDSKSEGDMVHVNIPSQVPAGFGYGFGGGMQPQMRMMAASAPVPHMMMSRSAPRAVCGDASNAAPPSMLMKSAPGVSMSANVVADDCDALESAEDSDMATGGSQMDKLMKLISLQSASGSFKDPNHLIPQLLGITREQLETLRAQVDETAFYTALAVEGLEIKFQDLKDFWEMVVDKARAWLLAEKQVSAELREQMRNILKSA